MGKLNKNREYNPNDFFDNPFEKGKIYKTNYLGRWNFNGELEIFGKIKEELQVKEKIIKNRNIPLSQIYGFLKTYDYTKVNKVLSRNIQSNFKTISKTEPR